MKAYEIIIMYLIILIITVIVIVFEQKTLEQKKDVDSRIERQKREKDHISDRNTRLTGMKENFYWSDGSSDFGIFNKIKSRLEEKMDK